MSQGIRRTLLLATTVVVALSLCATIFAVLHAASSNVEERAHAELGVAARVFDRLLADRNEQLASHATLLAEDLRFKQALAKHAITRSDRDIIDLLLAHERSIGADLSLLVDASGRVTSTASRETFSGGVFDSLQADEAKPLKKLAVVTGGLYQLVFAPVEAADWKAWIGMGFEVDADLLKSLSSITGMQASLLIEQANGSITMVSTLPRTITDAHGEESNLAEATAAFTEALEQHNWVSLRYVLPEAGDSKLRLLLSTSVADDLLAYQSLRAQLLTLGVLVLILTGAIAFWFSGKANHAIRSLAIATHRIARGDYSKSLALANSRQLSSLENAFNQMQEAIEERESRYSFQAQHDPLTGVPNRHHFEEWMKSQLENGDPPQAFALLLLQVCGLSQITDIYGPDNAVRLMKAVAERANMLVGPHDKMSRFESDQFLVYLDGVREEDVESLGERVRAAFKQAFPVEGAEIRLEIRAGMALCPVHGREYTDLLRRANIALSQTFAKKTLFEMYESGQDALHLRKIQITHSLHDAAKNGDFELLLQPQFRLATRQVERAEALLRWPDKTLGLVLPDEFIPLAERSGHITAITSWLVEVVVAQLADWQQKSIDTAISINVSAQDLLKETFVAHLIDTLERGGVARSKLLLEVTETAMVERPKQVIRNLRQLHRQGLTIAMDDFGTGFSSLSQLKSLPLHELKIDKSFVLNLDSDRDDQKIVHAAIDMAHNLKLEVVAEGVENLSSLLMLDSMGCDIIQGNYLGKPMPAAAFENWLAALDPQAFVGADRAQQSGGQL